MAENRNSLYFEPIYVDAKVPQGFIYNAKKEIGTTGFRFRSDLGVILAMIEPVEEWALVAITLSRGEGSSICSSIVHETYGRNLSAALMPLKNLNRATDFFDGADMYMVFVWRRKNDE